MENLRPGDVVRSLKCPEWGRGKVVACEAGKVFVVFENESGDVAKRLDALRSSLQPLPGESIPMLEHLPPFKKRGSDYVLDQRRLSLQELIAHFITLFPGRFEDPEYLGQSGANATGERAYKVDAHRALAAAFENGRAEQMIEARDGRAIANAVRSVLQKENLLATQERIAFIDALGDGDAAVRYLDALWGFLREPPTPESFGAYAAVVEALPKKGPFKVATWPVATLLPFLSLRHGHMFLKPEVTKKAAATLGVDLLYKPDLNWKTYARLLYLSGQLMRVLAPLGARDPIDLQSFIWIAYEYP